MELNGTHAMMYVCMYVIKRRNIISLLLQREQRNSQKSHHSIRIQYTLTVETTSSIGGISDSSGSLLVF